MSFRLRLTRRAGAEVRRVAVEQLDRSLDELSDPALEPDRKVRQVRRRIKKVRSVITLAHGSIRKADDSFFRDLNRRLSSLRDRRAQLETLEKLNEGRLTDEEAAALVAARHALCTEPADAADYDASLAAAAEALEEGRARVAAWKIPLGGFDAIEDGLEETYRRARRRLAAAAKSGAPEDFHDARKDVKHHWRHIELISNAWPRVLRARAEQARDLGELLGDDHDLTVLRQTLAAAPSPKRFAALDTLLDARSKRLRKQAKKLGARLFAEKPAAFRRRMRALWQA